MLRFQDIAHNRARLLALTRPTYDEFTSLVPAFELDFLERMRAFTFDGFPRLNRRYTPYKNSPLPAIEDKLLFILIHLKQHPTQEMHGQLFGMIQTDANKWLQVLRPVLLAALERMDVVPSQLASALTADDQPASGPPFYHDGTKRPAQRPVNADEQQEYWSGKQTTHAVKIKGPEATHPLVALLNTMVQRYIPFSPRVSSVRPLEQAT